ncbi:hypothetical protein Tco_0003237 [Tanacetum coccineum]
MSENKDRYHDNILNLEAKLKKNVDLMLKLGNSLQGMFMLGPKPLSVYDPQLKHGLGYSNPYTLKQAISQCPKLYLASSLSNSEIPLNVRDTEDTLDDASKSQQKKKEKMNDLIAVANKQNSSSIPASMPNGKYVDIRRVSLEFQVQSLIKERDNVKFEYQKLFDSIKKTQSQSKKEMGELIEHVSEKTYAYGAIRTENHNLLSTISELKTRLETVEKAKKVAVYVRKNKQTDNTSANVNLNKENVVQNVLWIVDSGYSKHMTGDRSMLQNFIEKFMGTICFGNDNFAAITGYGDYIQGNITICHVYYVEGLGHNLFSVRQFCDGDLEVAFSSKTCYVRNLEGDDLLTG